LRAAASSSALEGKHWPPHPKTPDHACTAAGGSGLYVAPQHLPPPYPLQPYAGPNALPHPPPPP
jgi:hypothetical protein